MRLRPLILCVIALFTLLPVTSFAAGGQQPPPNQGEYCSECAVFGEIVTCEQVENAEFEDPLWANCAGGWHCDYLPGEGTFCYPNCGERCLWV